MKDKWYTKPEMMVGLSALIVSLVAVLVSVYSAYVDRAYARASVWPRVTIVKSDQNKDGKLNYQYDIVNAGTGPAVFKYALVSKDEKYYSSWSGLFKGQGIKVQNLVHSYINTRVLPADKSFTALYTYDTKFIEQWRKIDSAIKIKICYCSIYDECWLVDRDNQPEPVEQCVAEQNTLFNE